LDAKVFSRDTYSGGGAGSETLQERPGLRQSGKDSYTDGPAW
jgi:hypothetical protein